MVSIYLGLTPSTVTSHFITQRHFLYLSIPLFKLFDSHAVSRRVENRGLTLGLSVPHFPLNFLNIVRWVPQLNAAIYLINKARKWK